MMTMTDNELDDLLRTTLAGLLQRRVTPAATYRLQFHKGFTFLDAARIVPYLHDLGITHCYASPYLKATAGSTHGYDVVDHTQLNPELGTREDFNAWMNAMRKVGMSHILDTVPNHMGVGSDDNKLWNDLLKYGGDSGAGEFFDVAWKDSPRPELKSKVLLPTLGEPYGDVLEKGQLRIECANDGSGYVVAYFDRHFPLSPESDAEIERVGLETINGKEGDARSFDELDAVLQKQHYRLAYWRTASDEINYRRFFDVSTLAALAMERQEVFDEAHALIFDLIAAGHISGLRIDHSDGLYDPKQYFVRLQRAYLVRMTLARFPGASDDIKPRLEARAKVVLPDDATEQPLYVLIEKILAPGEPLPKTWAMAGTSGYDILNEINGLFVDPRGEATLNTCYRNFVGADVDEYYHLLAYQKKRQILVNSFAGELNLLAHQVDRLAQKDRHTRDYTLDVLRDALTELIASFSVYRSYVSAADGSNERDAEVISAAIEAAKNRDGSIEGRVYDFLRDALLLRGRWGTDLRADAVRFAGKFQQLTSPVTAKGLEDTAFYIYHRLTSLNEVGGEPARFGVSPESLHTTFAHRQKNWPRALSVLSTHDTKRAEDVRARIHVLSELAEDWTREVGQWRTLTEPEGVHPNDEYLLYQTLIGAWPNEELDPHGFEAFAKRIDAYMLKAMREAKVRTSWTASNDGVEKAMSAFIARILDPERGRKFHEAFVPFVRRVARLGMVNSLAQTLLRLAAPGVPDTYQGTELWDLSLVDPDNRRPVDYATREKFLATLPREPSPENVRELVNHWQDGRVKLFLTATTLRLRLAHPALFFEGEYVPISATGPRAQGVFAFLRRTARESVAVIVPRATAGFRDASGRVDWQDTRLVLPDGGDWQNAFTGQRVTGSGVSQLLADFPVALLVPSDW